MCDTFKLLSLDTSIILVSHIRRLLLCSLPLCVIGYSQHPPPFDFGTYVYQARCATIAPKCFAISHGLYTISRVPRSSCRWLHQGHLSVPKDKLARPLGFWGSHLLDRLALVLLDHITRFI